MRKIIYNGENYISQKMILKLSTQKKFNSLIEKTSYHMKKKKIHETRKRTRERRYRGHSQK